MLFIACHPILPRNVQVALALKTVFGLGVEEIARLYFAKDATIAQRLVRAKQKIAEAKLAFELPEAEALAERVDGVLEALYALFSEGYNALGGEELLREDLCAEALRLVQLVAAHPHAGRPKVHALAASMAFAAARLTQRVSPEGDLLLLEDQDRSRWNQELVSVGFWHLERAATGTELSTYHVEAAIASVHASASTYAETNWARIAALYDLLQKMAPSPVTELNRAVAVAMAKGPEAGLKALAPSKKSEALASSHLVAGVEAALLEKLGRRAEAAALYRIALARAPSAPERTFLEKRIARVEAAISSSSASPSSAEE
jgi:RNA polymerase sigma-70 factor (ECF subfamily)